MTEEKEFSGQRLRREARDQKRKMRWERQMQRRTAHCRHMQHHSKVWLGVVIILVGVVWLIQVLGVPMPGWLFSWPMLLVLFGLASAIGSRFRNFGSFVLILIGLVFLGRNFIWPELSLEKYIWPIVIIMIGIAFLVKRHRWDQKREWFLETHPELRNWHEQWHQRWGGREWEQQHAQRRQEHQGALAEGEAEEQIAEEGSSEPVTSQPRTRPDWLDITNVFGGSRRNVISKNFKGGDVVNVCGGTFLDLTHADIQGRAVIDVVVMWGGIKVAVPPNWQVQVNVTHLLGGTDVPSGSNPQMQDTDKVLILTGVVIMGGIDIKNIL
jgi:predicted membrane protein